MDIHKQLRAIRQGAGVSQKLLAKLARATQKQVSLIEGGRDCYISTFRAMLKVLGYDLVATPVGKAEGGKNGTSKEDL